MQDERKVIRVVTSGVPGHYPDVQIYDSTIAKLKDKHPEEHSRIDEIYDTIAKPDRIHKSKTHPTSITLINETSTSQGGDPLRVAVKLTSDGNAAIMSTAHFTSSSDQGQLLWSREKDE